jgi:nitroreductase
VDTQLAIASRRDEDPRGGGAIPPDVVERILDAGRVSGSGSNRQPWTFVVVDEPGSLERLAPSVYEPDNVRLAGFAVGVLVAGKGPTSFDAGRASQNMLLAAWNEGLISTPNGIADEQLARSELGVADEERAVTVLAFGHPRRSREPERLSAAEWSARANRRPLSEIVRRVDAS